MQAPDGTAYAADVAKLYRITPDGQGGFGLGGTNQTVPDEVCPGDTVTIHFGRSNLGTRWVEFDTRFYMSTNKFISTYDTPVLTLVDGWAAVGNQMDFHQELTVPASAQHGREYWFGPYVDYNNRLPGESWGGNNKIAARARWPVGGNYRGILIRPAAECQ